MQQPIYTITILDDMGERTISAHAGENLYRLLIAHKVRVEGSCGGNGTCGKCCVRVIEGEAPPMIAEEKRRLAVHNLRQGHRLACLIPVKSDMVIEPVLKVGAAQIMTGGSLNSVTTDGEEGYGLAVDIGTTTVAAFLMDLQTGEVMMTRSALNAQRPFGADVIARCGHAIEKQNGLLELNRLICEQIDQLAQEACDKAGVSCDQILRVSLAGNPTMMHLAAKLNVSGIAVAPYSPAYTEGFYVTARQMGLQSLKEDTSVYCMPVVSGYVGADTIAAVMAAKMDVRNTMGLLVDIGTNGEIVLGDREKLLTCSAAAGPAFEGGKITCGIGGITGAVDKFWDENGPRYTTIGNKEPKGICGSGLIDLIAVLFRKGCIDETGVLSPDGCSDDLYKKCFDSEGNFVFSYDKYDKPLVYLTQKDVREVQLAKSALFSGIRILVKRMGIDWEQIDDVFLAGGFGSYIDYDSACEIGLLPKQLRKKIKGIGNAAGTGARMTVCSQKERVNANVVGRQMQYIELAEASDFSNEFMENMIFG